MAMHDLYRAFIDGTIGLAEAAEALRTQAGRWNLAPESVDLGALSPGEREKASELFDAAVGPILEPYFAGRQSSEVTASQLAPIVLPLGIVALGVPPGAVDAMPRLMELIERLGDLASGSR